MSHTFLLASKSFGVAVDPVIAVVICHLKPFDIASKSIGTVCHSRFQFENHMICHIRSPLLENHVICHTRSPLLQNYVICHTFSVVYKSCGDVNRLVVLPSVVTTKEQLFSSCGI